MYICLDIVYGNSNMNWKYSKHVKRGDYTQPRCSLIFQNAQMYLNTIHEAFSNLLIAGRQSLPKDKIADRTSDVFTRIKTFFEEKGISPEKSGRKSHQVCAFYCVSADSQGATYPFFIIILCIPRGFIWSKLISSN